MKYIHIYYRGFLSQTLKIHGQDSRERKGTMFYSSLPLASVHEYSGIYLQLCI